MFLSWGTWPTGQNVVLKFTCSSNGPLLTWYRRQAFLLKSDRNVPFPAMVWWEFMMGMRGRRCLILQVLSFAQGALKKSERWQFWNHKQFFLRDIWFSCCTNPILNTYLQTFRHFTGGKNTPRRKQHIYGLKIPKEVWQLHMLTLRTSFLCRGQSCQVLSAPDALKLKTLVSLSGAQHLHQHRLSAQFLSQANRPID